MKKSNYSSLRGILRRSGSSLSKFLLLPAFLIGLFMFVGMQDAQASHLRGANIFWKDLGGNQIEVTLITTWRRFASQNVGDSYSEGSVAWGDFSSQNMTGVVTSVDIPNDRFTVEFKETHTYPGPGNYTVVWDGCCRIFGLQNGASANFAIQTVVNVGSGNNGPTVTVAPIVQVPAGTAVVQIPIPAFDPDGDAITYRLSTPAETGGVSNPTGLTVDPTTGVVSFSTTGFPIGTLWAAFVTVEDVHGASAAVDFIIEAVGATGNPPEFVYPPTPTDGFVFNVNVSLGQSVSFPIRASDSDVGDNVNINGVNIPIGASFVAGTGNPANTSFSWTPAAGDVGTRIVSFTATDNSGQTVTTSVIINVVSCSVTAGTITTSDPTTICVGDGVDDFVNANVAGNTGSNNVWVVTDASGNILDPNATLPFNFEGAPGGVCNLIHYTYDGTLTGLVAGSNISAIGGCYGMSNSIVVTRNAAPCGAPPPPTAAIPTMGEWGLITFALLVLCFGLLFMMNTQPQVAGAGLATTTTVSGGKNWSYPFEKGLYQKALAFTMVGLAAIFTVAIAFFGYEMTNADVPGSLIAGPVFAYLVHLMILFNQEEE